MISVLSPGQNPYLHAENLRGLGLAELATGCPMCTEKHGAAGRVAA